MLFAVGARRRPKGWLAYVVTPLAVALAIYVIVAATVLIIAPWELVATFLCGILTLAFLTTGAMPDSDPEQPSLMDYALSLASFACGVYFYFKSAEIVGRIALLSPLSNWDLFFGILIVLLTLEITRRATGLGLFIVVLVFIAYNFFGHLLSGVLQHGYIDYIHFIDIMVYTTDGIMGLPARVAATYAFMFVLFGVALYYAKGADFFFGAAAIVSGRQPGGPAKVAVVSSGMFGMVSGSPTADVVTTGSVTIPAMKRLGYSGAVAGGIETAASTGGSLMPPVMGAAAFLMAEYTGIPYRDIVFAALLPAILYYICVYAQVHFRALRYNIRGLDESEIPKTAQVMRHSPVFAVPLAVLVVALIYGYTATMVAIFGALAVLVVSWLRSDTRIGLVGIWNVLAETTFRMVPVAGATAAAGLVIAGITMTGLASKFAHVIYAMTGANMFLTLAVGGALTIILGCGMPTPSAYILAAVLMGPLMNQLGVDLLAGQLFLLYFAVMSALTPPVAVAAYAAAAIAEDNPISIAGHAVKLAMAAFMVPFVFVYGPSLLWQGPLWQTGVIFVTAAIALILIAAAVEGYAKWCNAWWSRCLLAAAGIMMVTPDVWWSAFGFGLAVVTIAANRATLRTAAA